MSQNAVYPPPEHVNPTQSNEKTQARFPQFA